VISTPEDAPRFQQLLGDGSRLGLNFQYAVQETPPGIAQAVLVGKAFTRSPCCALVLGDNIFYGHEFAMDLQRAAQKTAGGAKFFFSPAQTATVRVCAV